MKPKLNNTNDVHLIILDLITKTKTNNKKKNITYLKQKQICYIYIHYMCSYTHLGRSACLPLQEFLQMKVRLIELEKKFKFFI
jgi:hypothetical protein